MFGVDLVVKFVVFNCCQCMGDYCYLQIVFGDIFGVYVVYQWLVVNQFQVGEVGKEMILIYRDF